MQTTMKRILLAVLVIALTVSFCACGEKKAKETVASEEIPETLTVWSALGGVASKVCSSNNDIMGYQLLEELTGCHIEWIHPTKGADVEKFNLMMASGELPDMICYDWSVVPGGAISFVEDEYIVELTDYVEKYMPNFKAHGDANPNVKKQYADDENRIYYIPFIRGDQELKVYLGPVIRTDWLEKLGLDAPKTTDDLYNVLKAFKTQDPNGNGQADEIPMTAALFKHTSHGIGNLLWAFGTHYDFYLEDGKVKYGVLEDKFEDGLKYITKLFSEGLIDPDYILLDRNKMDAKVTADKAGFLFGFQPTKVMGAMENVDPSFKWEGIEWLTGPDGDRKSFIPDYGKDVGYASVAITTACKNPVGAAKWIDMLFSKEGREYMNFGKEGVSFNYVDGEPILTDYVLNNPDGRDKDTMKTLSIAAAESSFPTLQDWRYYKQLLHPYGTKAIETWVESAETDGILPPLSFSPDEKNKITKIMGQVNTYTDELLNKIVIGEASVSELNTMRRKIKDMGIDEILDIYQAAYDRYNKR